MKSSIQLSLLLILFNTATAQSTIEWISTTTSQQWQVKKYAAAEKTATSTSAEILLQQPLQTMEGFGTCFNELGWTSLGLLKAADREAIMKELFLPGKGASFTICRMPVGANDFSVKWYSYNENAGDFAMKNFSIANDECTLIPFIKNALQYNPGLKLWASPWSPPTWMKYNKHYAANAFPKQLPDSVAAMIRDKWGMDFTGFDNGLQPGQEGHEGTDMFIQEEKYYKAYSLYFTKFIEAYKKHDIRISMVMPQNEFNSAQVFPSCTWTAKGLSQFLHYLAPAMKAINVAVFFGTMERANAKLVDTILTDAANSKLVKGVGFQWAGKEAIPAIHKNYPGLTLYQTEQECGNGYNDWQYCNYTWGLMKHYLQNGASAYMYWNTSLKQGGISTWGWHQNSLVTVDTVSKTYKYNFEYYLLKHVSHFVKPGTKLLRTSGEFNNLLAFLNPDKSIVIVAQNNEETEKTIVIKAGSKMISPVLEANSYNTFMIR